MKEKHSKETAELRARIWEKELAMFNYDNDGPPDTVKYISATWKFFSFARVSARVVSQHAKYRLSVVDQSGYSSSYAKVDSLCSQFFPCHLASAVIVHAYILEQSR